MAVRLLCGRYFGNGGLRCVLHVESRNLHEYHKTMLTFPYQCLYSCRYFTITPLRFYKPRRLALNGVIYNQYLDRDFYSSSSSQRKVLSNPSSLNLPSVKSIEQFLASKGIPFEHGHTSIVVGCLQCVQKEDKKARSMYINKTTGSHFCKNCGKSGSWRQFKVMYSEQDTSKPRITSPKSDPSYLVSSVSSESDVKATELWKNSEPLGCATESVRHKVLQTFGIEKLSEEQLTKYHVHVVDYKFSEPDGTSRDHVCVVFPWFDSNKSAVHGVKLVRVEQTASQSVTLQPRLGVLGLFGWNTVSPDAKEVVLTLNEFDAIAVSQASSYPAISLPLGTHSLPPEVLPQMEQFERIILWFGGDVRAKQAANQFSKKLNIHRCHIVRPSGDNPPTGPLDALNKGLDIKELITSSKPISHEKIATFQELRNDVYSELVNADQVAGVKWSRFPKLNTVLKGHRRGELTIFTGPTGAGKTTLLSEMSVDLCQQGVNTLWGSFEIRNVRLAKIMMNQFSGLDLQKNVQQFNYWADKFEMLPMYFMCFYGSQNINTVVETMAHAVYVFDIDHVIIDNLQFMTSSPRAEDRFSVQNQAISCLRDFASSKNVHVTLVIHPRKENDDVELQTASIFGTAKASQEADNVLILQDKKGRGEKYLQVTKNRFDGTVGRIPLEFVKASLSMCGFGKKDNNIRAKGSKMITSDIDMISIPSAPPIQKASFHTPRVRTYSPGITKSNKDNPGEGKVDVASNAVQGIRTFQGNVSDSIRSKSLDMLKRHKASTTPAGNDIKTETHNHTTKLNANKLYSNTVASLVAKHVNKNRLQERKVPASFGRLKATSSATTGKK